MSKINRKNRDRKGKYLSKVAFERSRIKQRKLLFAMFVLYISVGLVAMIDFKRPEVTETLSPYAPTWKLESMTVREVKLTPDEELRIYIRNKFGIENAKTVYALIKCESGWNPEAYNHNTNGSLDIGLMQINSINWEMVGMGIAELTDPYKNVDAGYVIWDRADGIVDGEGSFAPWYAIYSSCFVEEMK